MMRLVNNALNITYRTMIQCTNKKNGGSCDLRKEQVEVRTATRFEHI